MGCAFFTIDVHVGFLSEDLLKLTIVAKFVSFFRCSCERLKGKSANTQRSDTSYSPEDAVMIFPSLDDRAHKKFIEKRYKLKSST